MKLPRCSMALLVVLLVAPAARADVKLPALFSDNAVLQVGQELPFWGNAEPGEKVTVTVGDQTGNATADKDGKWSLRIKAISTPGPVEVKIEGKNTITLKNVLIGEVWVASGQSNMEWEVRRSNNAEEEIASAKHPKIRLFHVPRKIATEPQTDVDAQWVECSPEAIPNFSAVAYFFGRDLHKTLDRPVGLIESAWGGTVAEAWTSPEGLQGEPDYQPILERAEAAAKAAATDPKQANNPNRASVLYNGMLAPLIPYAIKGAIWYQGESNAGRAYQYRKLFPAMIRDWRKHWGEGDFPFLFVQLANFMDRVDEPRESAWAELREAQSMTLKLPKTGQAVIIDIGEAKNIHPKNKQDVGRRLALAAYRIAYDRDVEYSGPTFRSMDIQGNKITLHFDHADGGLVAKGGELKGFAISGEEKKFHWADAKIDGDTIVVSSKEVEKPLAVRYAWADNPEANLYNKEGLPASPFRTDDYPGKTVNAK